MDAKKIKLALSLVHKWEQLDDSPGRAKLAARAGIVIGLNGEEYACLKRALLVGEQEATA